jgi:hypothetical protein
MKSLGFSYRIKDLISYTRIVNKRLHLSLNILDDGVLS